MLFVQQNGLDGTGNPLVTCVSYLVSRSLRVAVFPLSLCEASEETSLVLSVPEGPMIQ